MSFGNIYVMKLFKLIYVIQKYEKVVNFMAIFNNLLGKPAPKS